MPRYVVTEPHPTVVQNTYIHAGRGGAGNLFRAPQTTPAEGVPTEIKQSSSQPPAGRFYSGRGGAGNVQSASVRPVLSLDEEYAITEARDKTHLFAHVGRGGAGNFFGGGVQSASSEKKDRKMSIASASSDRRDSTSSTGSARSGFLQRISSHLGRQSS